MTSLRIMTYNVGGFRGADGQVDVDRVAAVIAEGAPDLVALQQIGAERRALEHLAARIGMRVYTSAGDSAYLSDPPLRGVQSYAMGGGTCLRADVDVAGRRMHLFNAHLAGGHLEQARQAKALLGAELLGHRDLVGACLVLGTFPALCGRLRLLGALREVSRPWWSPTFPARRPFWAQDRAYLSGAARGEGGWVLATPSARLAAPHLPFLCSVQLVDPRNYLRLDREKHYRRGQMEIAPG